MTCSSAIFRTPETWKQLTTLVQVQPEADIFPVRARYATRIKEQTKSADMPTIGVNYLSADRPLWFTLADCVASKLLTGKAPKVVRAIRFSAKPPQAELSEPSRSPASAEYRGRSRIRTTFTNGSSSSGDASRPTSRTPRRRDPDSQEAKNLDMNQLALKILANATSYGIFIELNVEDADDEDAPVSIFTSQGKRTVEASKRELPGRYYHPLLATLITGAARLMLALTERLAFEHGLELGVLRHRQHGLRQYREAYLSTSSSVACRTSAIGSSRSTLTSPIRRKARSRSSKWRTQNFSKEKGKESELRTPLLLCDLSQALCALQPRRRGKADHS